MPTIKYDPKDQTGRECWVLDPEAEEWVHGHIASKERVRRAPFIGLPSGGYSEFPVCDIQLDDGQYLEDVGPMWYRFKDPHETGLARRPE